MKKLFWSAVLIAALSIWYRFMGLDGGWADDRSAPYWWVLVRNGVYYGSLLFALVLSILNERRRFVDVWTSRIVLLLSAIAVVVILTVLYVYVVHGGFPPYLG